MEIIGGGLFLAPAPAGFVAGDVSVAQIAEPTPTSPLRVQVVTFSAGARTHWHQHPLGQVLHVTAGTGSVQSADGPVRSIAPGDTVIVGPGEWHWHGAAACSQMSHLSVQIMNDTEPGAVVGLPVE